MLLIIFWNCTSKTGKITPGLFHMLSSSRQGMDEHRHLWVSICEDGHAQSGLDVPVSFHSDISHEPVRRGCFSEKGNIWGSPELPATLPQPCMEILIEILFLPFMFSYVSLRSRVSFPLSTNKKNLESYSTL